MVRSQLSHDKSHRFIYIVTSILNGKSIKHDHGVQSKMGYTMEFHSDGNLCVYKRSEGRPWDYIWESGTKGSSSKVLFNKQGTIQLLMRNNIVWEMSAGDDRMLIDFGDDALMVSYDKNIFWKSDLAIKEDLMRGIFDHLGFRLIYIDDNGKSLVETHGNIPLQHKIMEHGYRCISHLWGDINGQEWLQHGIDGVNHKVFVREEKRDKLMYLFDHYKGYFWMDVFCTNQEDDNKPLEVMDKIYANCKECICLIDGKFTYNNYRSDIKVDGIYNRGFKGLPRRDHESYDDVREDFCAIFPLFYNCRWITRMWILQETMLPPVVFYTEEALHPGRQHLISIETMSSIRGINKGYFWESRAFVDLLKAKTNGIYNSQQIYRLAIESERSCKEPEDYAYSLCGVFKTSIGKGLPPDVAIFELLKTLPDVGIFVITKSELHVFNNGPEDIYPIIEPSWESARKVFSRWMFQKQMYTFRCKRSNSYSQVSFDTGRLESKESLGKYIKEYKKDSIIHWDLSKEDATALSKATILHIMQIGSISMWEDGGITYWDDKHLYVTEKRVIITSKELNINIGDRIVLGQQRGFDDDAYLCDITEEKIVRPFGRVIKLWDV